MKDIKKDRYCSHCGAIKTISPCCGRVERLLENKDILESRVSQLEVALSNLVSYAERQTCMHEETHRAGFIWEVCDMCGMEWADDRGGKPDYVEPKEITDAYSALGAYSTLGEK